MRVVRLRLSSTHACTAECSSSIPPRQRLEFLMMSTEKPWLWLQQLVDIHTCHHRSLWGSKGFSTSEWTRHEDNSLFISISLLIGLKALVALSFVNCPRKVQPQPRIDLMRTFGTELHHSKNVPGKFYRVQTLQESRMYNRYTKHNVNRQNRHCHGLRRSRMSIIDGGWEWHGLLRNSEWVTSTVKNIDMVRQDS